MNLFIYGDTTMWLYTSSFSIAAGTPNNPYVMSVQVSFPQTFGSTPKVQATWLAGSANSMLIIAILSATTSSVTFGIINLESKYRVWRALYTVGQKFLILFCDQARTFVL